MTMPDWFAHLMLATVVSTCTRLDPWKRTLFFLGNVMPDLVRILVIADDLIHSNAFYTLVSQPINAGSHSLAGVLAYSLFISIFFEQALPEAFTKGDLPVAMAKKPGMVFRIGRWWGGASRSPFLLLVLGGVTHLFLDTFMWPFGGGVMWLYPIDNAWFRWSFGAWWPSTFDGILWLLPFFAAAIVAEIALTIKAKRVPRVQG
jgi:hypothetical protein